jgi:capsular exopolysaccharide synthesis family protein
VSRIHEALEKAKKERENLLKEEAQGFAGVTDSPLTVSPEDRERIRAELEKQGLVYKISPTIISYHSPKSTISEEYRILRTNFLSMAQNGKMKQRMKSVVISSANHKEGKSVTAVNFGFALAQDGQKRVLLVDCDFRKPSVRKLLGVRPKHDIIGVLTKDIPLQKAIIPTPSPQLSAMVVNDIPPNPAELIGSSRMKKLMSTLRSMYDYVIYDSPPIMAVTDAVILGGECDGVIMAVQARRTQRERIRDAEDLLRQAHVTLLGFLLTGVRSFIPRYFNQYQYYTTYKYVE